MHQVPVYDRKFFIEGDEMNFNILDIIILVLLTIGAINGAIQGLIVSVLNFASIFLSLILANTLLKPVSDYIVKNTKIDEYLMQLISKKIQTVNPTVANILQIFESNRVTTIKALTLSLLNILIFILMYFAFNFLLNFILRIAKISISKSKLKYIDKIGGMIFGLIEVFIYIFLFFAVITPIMGIVNEKSWLIVQIGNSKLAKYFYLYNFTIPWIQKSVKL